MCINGQSAFLEFVIDLAAFVRDNPDKEFKTFNEITGTPQDLAIKITDIPFATVSKLETMLQDIKTGCPT